MTTKPSTLIKNAARTSKTGKQIQKAAVRTAKHVNKYPKMATAAMLGLGAILGAIATQLFGQREAIMELLGVETVPARMKRSMARYF